jgi:ABC-2 type transport system permease protein
VGGTALVAERGIAENLRSRTFKVITALLLLSSIAAVTIPQVLSGAGTTHTIATIGKAPAQVAALDAAGKSADFTVRYVSRSDGPAVRRAVREGDATAGLAGGTLYTSATSAGTFPVVVAQTVVALETSRRLSEAGLSPRQVADLLSIRPPKQVIVGRADNSGRADVGFAVGIVLYLALMIAGSGIATTVAMEKSTRISEVLLAVLRPSQALVGTVIAVGTVTLVQLLVLATPLAVAVRVTDKIGVPPIAAGDIALAVAWFAPHRWPSSWRSARRNSPSTKPGWRHETPHRQGRPHRQ